MRSEGDQRAQLKWLTSGGVIAIVSVVGAILLGNFQSPVIRAI